MVVVASGAPGTPLVCCADAGPIKRTASAKTETVNAEVFMSASFTLWDTTRSNFQRAAAPVDALERWMLLWGLLPKLKGENQVSRSVRSLKQGTSFVWGQWFREQSMGTVPSARRTMNVSPAGTTLKPSALGRPRLISEALLPRHLGDVVAQDCGKAYLHYWQYPECQKQQALKGQPGASRMPAG